MDKVTLLSKKASWDVLVTMDASDWQLYTLDGLEAASEAAAQSINAGIRALALQGCDRYSEYQKLLRPFVKLGACDTEPECMLDSVLRELGIVRENEGRFA